MEHENKIAASLKTIAWINGVAIALGVAFLLASATENVAGFIIGMIPGGLAGYVSSIIIYAFGELLQLLEDIRYNTGKALISSSNPAQAVTPKQEEIPDL